MQHPPAFQPFRHPAGGRPEDAAPTGEVPFGRANNGDASGSALGLCLGPRPQTVDMSDSEIHKGCKESGEEQTDCRPRPERDPPHSTAVCADAAGRDACDKAFPVQGSASSSAAPGLADGRRRGHTDAGMDAHDRIHFMRSSPRSGPVGSPDHSSGNPWIRSRPAAVLSGWVCPPSPRFCGYPVVVCTPQPPGVLSGTDKSPRYCSIPFLMGRPAAPGGLQVPQPAARLPVHPRCTEHSRLYLDGI